MAEQYLTECHYLVCPLGANPVKVKVTSQSTVKFSGHLAATTNDKQLQNTFKCLKKTAFFAGVLTGIALAACVCIPGPGWLVAGAIIAAGAVGAVVAAATICGKAASGREWIGYSQKVTLQHKSQNALLLSSTMMCPNGGPIVAKETFWAAWGSQSLTNLGHIANFAFGVLVGRGLGAVAMEGGAAYGTATAAGSSTSAALSTAARTAGQSLVQTARREMVEQFTFKNFWRMPNGQHTSWLCRGLRGLGIGGAYYDQYNIWSSDKSLIDKLQASGVSLILGVFAAKGATQVCFPAGTQVHTRDGLVNIEDLQIGDPVLTYNEQTEEQEYKAIQQIHVRYTLQMMAIELPNGEVLEVTPEHRFYSNGEWVEAMSLEVGDTLQTLSGVYTTISGIENFPKHQKVYNFDIADNENYYVTEDGLLVHNGYGSSDGFKLEEDIQNALDKADIPNNRGLKYFDDNGRQVGEIDLQTEDWIIEATVSSKGKLKQIKKYFSELLNPDGKKVVLIGPNYINRGAVNDIKDTGAEIVHSVDDLIDLIK